MSNRKWVLAGVVGVDSGTVMVVDPCYVLPETNSKVAYSNPEDKGLDYFTAVSLDIPSDHPKSPNNSHRLLKEGRFSEYFRLPETPGGGVITSSGYGDGAYNVFALVSDEGDWGHRVMGLFIDFNNEFSEDDLPEFGTNIDVNDGEYD